VSLSTTVHHGDALVLAVDGGGTSTEAWLGRAQVAGDLAGRGTSGPANPHSVGWTRAKEHLQEAIQAAFSDANIAPRPVASAVLGVAGTDNAEDRATLAAWADARQLAQTIRWVNDAEPLLFVPPMPGWGIVVINGTGSFAYGRTREGTTARAGGWGYLAGDDGSAYDLGRSVLRRAAWEEDRNRPRSAMTQRILEIFQRATVRDASRAINQSESPRKVMASLAILATALADQGEPYAVRLLEDAARDLAEIAAVVRERLSFSDGSYRLGMAGGVFLGSALVRERFLNALKQQGVCPSATTLIKHPVSGALNIARREVAQ